MSEARIQEGNTISETRSCCGSDPRKRFKRSKGECVSCDMLFLGQVKREIITNDVFGMSSSFGEREGTRYDEIK